MSSGLSTACLSAAAILRCPSLTRFQYVVILIPTVLEAIFTSSLAVMIWKAGQRRHLLLTSEGWMHLILGIIDLLSHLLTSARTDVGVFSTFDVGLGVASFVPLFLYTFYLYIYSNSDLLSNVPTLPKLLARIASLLLLFCIPAIIITNEIGSHVGIRRISFQGQILIGFPSRSSLMINAFFTSLTLALLIVFQALVFLISFFRLFVALMNQRKFQNKGKDAAHLVKGIAWISIGMKLGAIETLLGFVGGGFDIVLTRKILHFISRACLCIGVVKGVDMIEDFSAIRREMREATSRSKFTLSPFDVQSSGPDPLPHKPNTSIRGKISNPRASTFQQLSPTAKGFYQLPRAHLFQDSAFDWNKDAKSPDSAGGYSVQGMGGVHVSQVDTNGKEVAPRLGSLQELRGIEAFVNLKDQVQAQREANNMNSIGEDVESKSERVTIGVRDSNGAPTLLLKRFSSAKFPSPTDVLETIRKSLFRSSQLGSIPESERRGSAYPATILAGYGEKDYGDSYTIPTLSKTKRMSTVSSFDSKVDEKHDGEDPVSLLRPNVSRIPSKQPPFPVQSVRRSQGPGHYIRNSVIRASQASFADSSISGVEIVSGIRRTLSQKRAEARFYSVSNSQFESSTQSARQSPLPANDATITPPPKAMFVDQLVESPESYGPLSSAGDEKPATSQFRIVSDYSQFRDSMATDYRDSATSQVLQSREVRKITRQFPGPPLTFNGRPVMGGLEQRKIYDDSDSSLPTSPVPPMPMPANRRTSGLRYEVELGRQNADGNRLSVRSEMSERSGMSISSGFETVVPAPPNRSPPQPPTSATGQRSSLSREIVDNLRYKPNRQETDNSSQYSFDVDLESGKRNTFGNEAEGTPKIVILKDMETPQRSPATVGHGSTPTGNALGLLRPKMSTDTLGAPLRRLASMASLTTEAPIDPFRDAQDSPSSTTFAVDMHGSHNQMPSSATGSPSTSRSVTPIITTDLLSVPSHNVSAPTSPGDDDMALMNRFSVSPMSVIDNLPTAAIIDSVNDSQRGRGGLEGGWPAFRSPESTAGELPRLATFRSNAALPTRRGRPLSQMIPDANNISAPARPLPQVPGSAPVQPPPPARPPTPPMPSSRSRSRSSSRTRSKSHERDIEKRRRQRSMEVAAADVSSSIPWLTNRNGDGDRQLQKVFASKNILTSPISPLVPGASRLPSKTYSTTTRRNSLKSSSLRGSPKTKLVPIAKFKTIGNVKQRTTPRPIRNHAGMERGSMHIQPIMIPRQSASFSGMYVVNEESPATTTEEGPSTDRRVSKVGRSAARRDSDVFGASLSEEMRRQD